MAREIRIHEALTHLRQGAMLVQLHLQANIGRAWCQSASDRAPSYCLI
jgi:hypothetical protein